MLTRFLHFDEMRGMVIPRFLIHGEEEKVGRAIALRARRIEVTLYEFP